MRPRSGSDAEEWRDSARRAADRRELRSVAARPLPSAAGAHRPNRGKIKNRTNQ